MRWSVHHMRHYRTVTCSLPKTKKTSFHTSLWITKNGGENWNGLTSLIADCFWDAFADLNRYGAASCIPNLDYSTSHTPCVVTGSFGCAWPRSTLSYMYSSSSVSI